MATFTNRLIHETSPYLRQHAHNPVDWYPWGEEALAASRELDRPIFLSIGYSACHWCHVMEHESFEDPAIGEILNNNFISIKVDREERPDIDQIYMTAVQLITQQGGWPMSMFLTPTLQPFYGGTYFPPDDRYGRPGFRRLLATIIQAWKENRQAIDEQAHHIADRVKSVLHLEPNAAQDLTPDLLRAAGAQLSQAFDPREGGFGSAPKFPHPMEVRLLLRLWSRFGDEQARGMARFTLGKMARGGIYDHLGGGFHRYSTDARWLVPHFEKMLYDNALLTRAYLEAFQATKDPFFRKVVDETIGYVLREMTSDEGAFYSTQDADSEGVEGKFFVWSRGEVEQIVGEDAGLFCDIYDVSERGNWEGHNILNRKSSDEDDAARHQLPVDELRRRLDAGKKRLFEVRSKRIWPGLDDKILTAWNGLMIAALADAGAALGERRYIDAAARAADFILTRMRSAEGRLLRTTSPGKQAKLNGYLEDYAFTIDALVSLYQASFEPRWLESALELAEGMIQYFWDEAEGGFFYTGNDHEQLIARGKDPHDSAIPSGNSMAVTALLALAKLTGRGDLQEKAERTLQLFRPLMASSPMAAGQMLAALDFHLGPVQEFAIVGDLPSESVAAVLKQIHVDYRPNKVMAAKAAASTEFDALIPLLAQKTGQGDVTTYICENFACKEPLVGAGALEAALKT